uniref:E3 SUMO-protein ligase KIAA1586-like n=1 Tax=Diabrotica virgifera virgifera TaxID=50390 RepID=A0A6P7H088_DIAVI
MDKIYSTYSKSPKNQRELSECASKLEQQLQKIGKVLGTRWVASSYRAVSAVWYGYSAIYNHFEKAKTDKNRSSTERSMYCGLSRQLSSLQFLLNLAIIYDILAELPMLSEALQNRETTVVYADKLIRRSIRFFETLKETPGTKSLEAYIAEKDGNFNNVPITNNPKIATINHKQVITSVINNLTRRMFTTKSSHESKSSASSNCKQQYDSLLSDLKVLETDQYPTDKSVRYGEEQIQNLCKRFKLNKAKITNCFRDYIEANSPSRIPKDLIPLLNCTKLIPCSSSECERGFSLMNQIMTDLRTRLLTRHVSSLMFIKQHGPSITEWNVEPYVNTWLRRHRTADDTRTRTAKPYPEEENPFVQFL